MNVPVRRLLAQATALVLVTLPAAAQTDYYNTDAGRPITVEDAYPVERRAFELQVAPLRVERADAGIYHWGIEPEVAYGILPRTHVEVGLPLQFTDDGPASPGGGARSGIAGLHAGIFHNLNTETSIPALALAVSALLPVGPAAPSDPYISSRAILTRTLTWARFHLNGEYTAGTAPAAGDGDADVSRWMAGVAADRTLPLRSMLFTGEVVARQPIVAAEAVAWSAGMGVRYQLGPRTALDAGIARRFTGSDQAWSVTFGSAWAFGLPWYPR